MKKRIIALLAIMMIKMLPAVCLGEEVEETEEILTSGDYEYFLNKDDTVTIIDWDGEDEYLEIPSTIDGNRVTTIDKGVFANYSNLSSITIPDSVTSIGANAFSDCQSLNQITVSPQNETYAVIDNVLFNKKEKELVCYPAGLNAGEYCIPDGIVSIGAVAFGFCSSLRNVEIPDSVTSIGDEAFKYCSSLSNIDIPDSVTSIGELAFSFCDSLSSIEIPDSVTSIGNRAFFNCDNAILLVGRDAYASQYAKDNGLSYTYPDANDWLND